jgi:heme oxygenase (biliverdin-IX-beta and delta-forming)
MAVEEAAKPANFSGIKETALAARSMVRAALKGSLASLLTPSGHPYASLLLTATEPDGAPVFLISKLALHTKNLSVDARCSLLIDGTGTDADPMAGARITLIGEARPTSSATARARFLARHPAAEGYADFPDFSFYAFDITSAHFIGGFGRIVDLKRDDLLIDVSGAEALIEREADITGHMNEDHADAIELYATRLLGASPGAWNMSGIDPEGCDLVLGARALRLPFETRVTNGEEARKELVRLVGAARSNAA